MCCGDAYKTIWEGRSERRRGGTKKIEIYTKGRCSFLDNIRER